jgi:hypothetical protein
MARILVLVAMAALTAASAIAGGGTCNGERWSCPGRASRASTDPVETLSMLETLSMSASPSGCYGTSEQIKVVRKCSQDGQYCCLYWVHIFRCKDENGNECGNWAFSMNITRMRGQCATSGGAVECRSN